jgi:hypothetical protein
MRLQVKTTEKLADRFGSSNSRRAAKPSNHRDILVAFS